MKKELESRIKTHGVTDFKTYETITLADEIQYQIKVYNFYLSWHRSWYDAFSALGDELEKVEQYRELIQKDLLMISHLNSIENNYKQLYDEVSFTTYMLTYLYVDDTGSKNLDICFGKFNRNGEMVAFKQTGKSKWEIIGDDVSIPDFHKYESEL